MSKELQHAPIDPVFDLLALWQLAGYAVASVRRHARMVGIVAGAVGVLAGIGVALTPKAYKIETRVLTHPSIIMPTLRRDMSPSSTTRDATRGAAELIRSRENLIAVIDRAKLRDTWAETRAPVGLVMDWARTLVAGPLSDEDFVDALVAILEKKVTATVESDVIIMTVTWHDRNVAMQIAEVLQKRFLEGAKTRELGQIEESIKLLSRNVEPAQQQLTRVVEDLRSMAGRRRIRVPTSTVSTAPAASSAASGELLSLERELDQRRDQIARLETSYRDRVNAAQSRLDNLRGSLGPGHPDVGAATRDLESQSRPPEELSTLRVEEARLLTVVRRLRGDTSRPAPPPEVASIMSVASGGSDTEAERAMQNYRRAEQVHSDVVERLEEAQMDQRAAEAAFAYKYLVTMPPVLPRRHVSPQAFPILLVGLFAGAFLGAVLAVFVDVRSGRVFAAWQVERFLGMRLLGRVSAR